MLKMNYEATTVTLAQYYKYLHNCKKKRLVEVSVVSYSALSGRNNKNNQKYFITGCS